jgi:hypothetical protein
MGLLVKAIELLIEKKRLRRFILKGDLRDILMRMKVPVFMMC